MWYAFVCADVYDVNNDWCADVYDVNNDWCADVYHVDNRVPP